MGDCKIGDRSTASASVSKLPRECSGEPFVSAGNRRGPCLPTRRFMMLGEPNPGVVEPGRGLRVIAPAVSGAVGPELAVAAALAGPAVDAAEVGAAAAPVSDRLGRDGTANSERC